MFWYRYLRIYMESKLSKLSLIKYIDLYIWRQNYKMQPQLVYLPLKWGANLVHLINSKRHFPLIHKYVILCSNQTLYFGLQIKPIAQKLEIPILVTIIVLKMIIKTSKPIFFYNLLSEKDKDTKYNRIITFYLYGSSPDMFYMHINMIVYANNTRDVPIW